MGDPLRSLYVIECNGVGVGYCRVEGQANELSIAILGEARGKGIGEKALELLFKYYKGQRLKAVVRNENKASQRLFSGVGFRLVRRDDDWQLWQKQVP